jgi:hypothetical protein
MLVLATIAITGGSLASAVPADAASARSILRVPCVLGAATGLPLGPDRSRIEAGHSPADSGMRPNRRAFR